MQPGCSRGRQMAALRATLVWRSNHVFLQCLFSFICDIMVNREGVFPDCASVSRPNSKGTITFLVPL